MLKYLLSIFFIFFLSFITVFCGEPGKLTATNSKTNVLYVGIDNPIILNFDTLNIEELIFSCSNGTIFQDSGNLIIMPSRSGRTRIFVHSQTNDSAEIYRQDFLVYSLPQPQLYFGELIADSLDYISKDLLLKNILRIVISDDILNSSDWLKIKGFTVGYMDGAVYKNIYNEGALITQETFKRLNKIKPGKEISIKVNVESEGNIIRTLPVYTNRLY